MQSKERFSIECRQTKTKVIKRPIEAEEYTPKLQEKADSLKCGNTQMTNLPPGLDLHLIG